MFFWLSKALWTFADPANFLLLLALFGVVLMWLGVTRSGRALVSFVVALLLLISVVPVGGYMLAALEARFPAAPDPADVDGIIVLGGALDAASYYANRGSGYTGSIGRIIEAARLARRHPSARLIVAGGPELASGHSEAEAARDLLGELGVASDRIELETKSRNTSENAEFVKRIADPRRGQHWLLVTSAFHMPRAMGCFRAAGFPIEAFPVDFQYGAEAFPRFDLFDGLSEIKYAIHEYVGLFVYWVSGKTETLLPGA